MANISFENCFFNVTMMLMMIVAVALVVNSIMIRIAYSIYPFEWQNKCANECIIHIHLQLTDLLYFTHHYFTIASQQFFSLLLFFHFNSFFQTVFCISVYKCNDFQLPVAHRHINPNTIFLWRQIYPSFFLFVHKPQKKNMNFSNL